ncbi:MAG TPA: thiamine pyrophosphate-dependent enzyme [Atribacteraceae bacterium]|nr:thiamine pyrophosphate-dependent enzyme [Atribacteraceae bacterium]
MTTLKELAKRPGGLTPGHRLCAGCGAPIAVRLILAAADKPVVASSATGCLEVSTSVFPYTAWDIPWIHSAFENSAATISGVEAMYRAKKKKGEISEEIYFVAFGGDGGTYDIGLQSLSGALERGHRFVYVCYNNEAYMNTGIQRSSATPLGAWTTTSPHGKAIPGKTQWRKNMTEIVAAHDIPYVAQSVPSNWRDLTTKAEKAFHAEGPAFLNVLTSCNRGWRHLPAETLPITQLAVDTCVWPLYEIEKGKYRLNYKPKEKKPVEEWLKAQGRFHHLFVPANRHLIDRFQEYVDREWERLLVRCE